MMLELKHVQLPYDPQWTERVYNPGCSLDDLGIEINMKSGEGISERAPELQVYETLRQLGVEIDGDSE